jgi:hypothetical protein
VCQEFFTAILLHAAPVSHMMSEREAEITGEMSRESGGTFFMKTRNIVLGLSVCVGIACSLLGVASSAQTPAAGTAAKAAASATHGGGPKAEENLLQLMRGILYPSSNVIFAAQSDISKIPPAPDPSVSTNPLTNTYGGWTAVENASLALAESANLLTIPRLCSNGKPAPVQRADWQQFVAGLRKAGQEAYKAAQSKNSDTIVDASGDVTDACSACHNVYRDKKGGVAARCTP